MARTRSRSLIRTLGLLLIAGVAYFARSQGWIDFNEESGGGTAVEASQTSSAPAAPAAPPPEALEELEPSAPSTGSAEGAREEGPSGELSGADKIVQWFRAERSGFMVETPAVVYRKLPDDNEGSRHQKFLIRLENGHSVLVAHNIDLAPRVPLEEGDTIEIKGSTSTTTARRAALDPPRPAQAARGGLDPARGQALRVAPPN